MNMVRENPEKRYRSLVNAGGRGNFVVLMTALSMILLAFFILLYSVSVVDEQRRLVALDSLLGSFGFMPGGFNLTASAKNKQLQPPTLLSESVANLQASLHDFLARRGIQDDVKVRKTVEGGVAIDLRNKLLFPSGSYRLSKVGRQVLLRLAGILRSVTDLQIKIKGYSDRVPVKAGSKFSSNLALAALRATAVYHFLAQDGGIPPEVMDLRGYGATAAKTKGSAAMERRVELAVTGGVINPVTPGSKPRLYHFKDFTLPITGNGG